MRGKGTVRGKSTRPWRITPAYAGKSTSFRQLPCSCQDHPRLCGEKHGAGGTAQWYRGSPPPMRGKVVKLPQSRILSRITPAYAGKSVLCNHLLCQRKDHPRLCGEKSEPENCDMNNQGSPPPMRGKENPVTLEKIPLRITPAYAGKSRDSGVVVAVIRDHPRLCGEKFRIHLFITCQPGSPPPMRGKVRYSVALIGK